MPRGCVSTVTSESQAKGDLSVQLPFRDSRSAQHGLYEDSLRWLKALPEGLLAAQTLERLQWFKAASQGSSYQAFCTVPWLWSFVPANCSACVAPTTNTLQGELWGRWVFHKHLLGLDVKETCISLVLYLPHRQQVCGTILLSLEH